MKKRIKKTVKWLLGTVVTLLIAGFAGEQGLQLYFNSQKPGAREFCEIAGRKVHFVKKGSGGPTVVFQSGLGGDYKIWEPIQDSLSRFTTTISYDRAGLQWSDPLPEAKTLAQITSELHELLEKTACPKPYILVGHSLAGITLRPFIRDHADAVAAVVFLDVSHPLQMKKSSEDLKKRLVVPPAWLITALVETGLCRLYFSLKPFITDVPRSHWMNRHVRDYFYRSYRTFLQEAADDDPMFEQAETMSSFGAVPLTAVTGAYPNGIDFLKNSSLEAEYLGIHRGLQRDLLRLSTQSEQLIAPKSGHYVPLTDEALVIQSVRKLLPSPNKKNAGSPYD